ncbi:LIM domain-containing protein HDR3-like isoform X6 [Rhododendron vialii]|uniref:LIM domain-containing protein HDR3-like isoform X6 n=1 Tax=Rhododendron vialii TaxID=182163 RepID=UPI00265FD068|nr:LIM domain-containing protein HDR3-like isoform X6 [Rhododendron vialii]
MTSQSNFVVGTDAYWEAALWLIAFRLMGWLSKIFKGSSHKVSEGQYDWNDRYSEEETVGNEPSTSGDAGSETEDIDHAIALSLLEEDHKRKNVVDYESQLKEDEQIAKALQESWNIESPPRYGPGNGNGHGHGRGNANGNGNGRGNANGNGNGNVSGSGSGSWNGNGNIYQPMSYPYSTGVRVCAGCNTEIGYGRFLNCMNAVWHPECFRCHACNQPICDYEFSLSGNYPYHKFCYKENYHPKCDVCKHFIPTNAAGLIEYRAHPFWVQKYCPFHEHDGTPRCCSCERMEGHHHMPETRGLCLSEEQTVSTILRRPKIGAGNRVMNMITEPYKLIRRCEVTAILILYGLPRLLTGSILAHEMMHAWLRLQGYRTLSQDVEEGICQVLAHLWLESQIMSTSGSNGASTSSSASVSRSSKQGTRSPFERKLGDFFKHQIESDASPVYGNGFRAGNHAVLKYGLRMTLDHIRLTGGFPY